MENPLKVSLENIIPLTFARDHFSQIVSEVQQDKLFVLTKGGKPAVAIIDVKYLESITGGQVQRASINEEIKKAPEKVGLPPMVEHPPLPPKPAGFTAPTPQPKPTPKPFSPPPPPPSFKPAGFAAPSFAKATEDKPQPKPFSPSTPTTPPPKPFENTQGKPAGFAAPQPKPIEQPKPQPKSFTPTPPPAFKPEPPKEPPISKPFDPAQGKPEPPKPQTPISTLQMPEEKQPAIPNKPLVNLPPVNQKPTSPPSGNVDIQFAPDDEKKETDGKDGEWSDHEKNVPDDENSPAQYAGEKDRPKDDEEPEDMALD